MSVDISKAVQQLLEARRSGVQVKPPFALPDRAAVYAIQDGVAKATGPVAGWKVGARTPTAEPNPAPLLAGALVKSPVRFDGKAMHMIGVEIEISFHIAKDMAARAEPVGRDEALAAVGDAFVGMEVVDTRLADFKAADPEWLLADNQMNHALVIGDPIPDWRGLDWANLQVKLVIDGKTEVEQKGGLGAVEASV
jgi:2-keto-4-pentenoate hydratase